MNLVEFTANIYGLGESKIIVDADKITYFFQNNEHTQINIQGESTPLLVRDDVSMVIEKIMGN